MNYSPNLQNDDHGVSLAEPRATLSAAISQPSASRISAAIVDAPAPPPTFNTKAERDAWMKIQPRTKDQKKQDGYRRIERERSAPRPGGYFKPWNWSPEERRALKEFRGEGGVIGKRNGKLVFA